MSAESQHHNHSHSHSHDHSHSEATRLLCAGAYVDADFRRGVLDELIGHSERPVPASLGVDVLPVLAHALRARRQEAQAALVLLLLWIAFFVVEAQVAGADDTSDAAASLDSSGGPSSDLALGWGFPASYAVINVLLLAGRALLGRRVITYVVDRAAADVRHSADGGPTWWRRGLGNVVTSLARLLTLGYWLSVSANVATDPFALIFPLLLALVVWFYRAQVESVLRDELAGEAFATRSSQSATLRTGRLSWLRDAITREQSATGGLHDPALPFVGAGTPYEPWSLALELKPKDPPAVESDGAGDAAEAGTEAGAEAAGEAGADGATTDLTSSRALELIKPRLRQLRESAARDSRDRLKDLEVEEFVYLPAGVGRHEGVYEKETIDLHLRASVNEGGEARRHFLRIRVGAWDEQVVVTLFVRVHTQGHMLVLEVAPHVLGPVSGEYKAVDTVAARLRQDVLRDAVRALLVAPSTSVALGTSAARTIAAAWRNWLADPDHAAPGVPQRSVREMGSTDDFSLFQEMDVSRYVKTIQDRIASGVRDALEECGYQTDRFEQQIVNVSDGGLFIKDMSGGAAVGHMSGGALATGDQGQAHYAAAGGRT